MNNELFATIKKTEEKINNVKKSLYRSKCLDGFESSEECSLFFDESRSCLTMAIKYDYELLLAWKGLLEEEGNNLEYRIRFNGNRDPIFVYGEGAIVVWFYCKAYDIPEELKRYKK